MYMDKGAAWIRQQVVTEKLTKLWGIHYMLRKYLLVVKFVPVECDLDKEHTNILKDNQLTKNMVHGFKWMKPAGR